MGIILWIVLGLIAGFFARCIMPGQKNFSVIITVILGVSGAVTGGAISTALGYGNVNGFNIHSILIATLGSLFILYLSHWLVMFNKGK
ncbi:GlsB/YeaQ/YmgE family stress response membrane protein [Enterobacter cancerogenus]|uniref:GlsB/YeaQ/YmgE family stress response membrane protein n=1 Tax=Enterobacter cancerogenus TaxID=69218 RepID=UPI004059E7AB